MTWDPRALPDQSGRTVLITGANAGLGYFSAEQLAGAGAHVILAGRSPERLAGASAALRSRVPGADVSTAVLDLADAPSVDAAVAGLSGRGIDVVMANAGVIHTPRRRTTTADGRELVFATNLLGHARLVAGLLPGLPERARVVWLGSLATVVTDRRPTDPELVTGYTAWRAYAQSKVMVAAFGFELDRRLRSAARDVASLVAHPGYAITARTPPVPGVAEPRPSLADRASFFAQGKDAGAWPQVRAAADTGAVGGQYYGPARLTRGAPVLARATRTTRDPAVGRTVWAYVETALGCPIEVAG